MSINTYARSALPLARIVGQLAVFPAVLVPIWLIGLSASSTLGIAPGGAALLGLISVFLIKFYSRSLQKGSIIADIASRLATNCWIIVSVSSFFLAIQIACWLWVTDFSPTLYAITSVYNHLSSHYVLHLSSDISFATRVALIAFLALVIFFGPILSTRALRLSRSISTVLDISTTILIAVLLFSFYGGVPGGLNAATIVLRTKQNEISELYGRAISEASHQILSRAITQIAKDDAILSAPPAPISGAPPPTGPGSGGPGPKPSPPDGGPNTGGPQPASPELNDWDGEVYTAIVKQDAKRTQDTVTEIKKSAENKLGQDAPKASDQSVPKELFSKITASSASDLPTTIYSVQQKDTVAPDIKAAQELVDIALDAKDFPDVINAAIEHLRVETISGKACEELIGVMGDGILQDALRAAASNVVGDLIRGLSAGVSRSDSVQSYASAFLNSTAGQKLKSALGSFRDYRFLVTARLKAYRQGVNDPIVATAEQAAVGDVEQLISKAAVYPKVDPFSPSVFDSDSARTKSDAITDDLVTKIAEASRNNASVAKEFVKIKEMADAASTPRSKTGTLKSLLSLAQSTGIAQSDVVLCSCVGPTGPLYSFYTTKALCSGRC